LSGRAKRVAAFIVRYVWSGACCLYLFTFGWLSARNRGFLYQICAHFRPPPAPGNDRQVTQTTKVRRGAPTSDEAERFLARLSDTFWFQRFEIAPGVFTPRGNDVVHLCQIWQIPSDLSGKRVLDIGAANGGFSFEMEKRGASVVAVDIVPDDYFSFRTIADFLGSTVEYRVLSAYDLDPNDIGTFDIVLFLGVVYHLRHPLLALDKIWGVTKKCCYVESHVIDGGLVTPWGFSSLNEFDARLTQLPIVEFHRLGELNRDVSNWFSPTIAALDAWLWSAGFEPELIVKWPSDKPVRCAFRAKKLTGPPEWLRHMRAHTPPARFEG